MKTELLWYYLIVETSRFFTLFIVIMALKFLGSGICHLWLINVAMINIMQIKYDTGVIFCLFAALNTVFF